MKQPAKCSLKYYYTKSALVLLPLILLHMRDIPIGRKHFMFQLDLFSMRHLDYFSLAILNNCLLCSVLSVLSIFLVNNNSSKIRRVMVQMSSKSAHRNLAIKTSTVSKKKISA